MGFDHLINGGGVSAWGSRTRRFVAAMLVGALAGCQTWRPTPLSPQALIPQEQPASVRVTLKNGATVVLESPSLRNDSIVSATDDAAVVAMGDVRVLEVRRFNPLRSIGLVAVTAFIAAAWATAVGTAGGDGGDGRTPLPKD